MVFTKPLPVAQEVTVVVAETMLLQEALEQPPHCPQALLEQFMQETTERPGRAILVATLAVEVVALEDHQPLGMVARVFL